MFKLVNKILESARHGFNIDMSDIMDPEIDPDDIDDIQTNQVIYNLRQYKYHPTTTKELVRSMVECYRNYLANLFNFDELEYKELDLDELEYKELDPNKL